MDKLKEMKRLVNDLNDYCYEYYTLDNPSVSDNTYDKLYDELLKLEKETGIMLSNSPTQRIGYEIKDELTKVTHKHTLQSLDKTKDSNALMKFLKNKSGVLMLKLDGLTNELIYRDGVLVEASTRGNGTTGENILHNVKTYTNIPLTIPCKDEVRIIGEAIITYDVFEKINKNNEFKNPRNTVAGSVRQLDSNVCKQRQVKFMAYNVYDKEFNTKIEQLAWLEGQGFSPVLYQEINPDTDINKIINELKDLAEYLCIPIDGEVLTFNDLKYASTLGKTSHHPLHSIAYKFTEDIEFTTLRNVEWQVGRTGVITPVAVFDEVELAGTTVNKASLHNISIIKGLKLGLLDTLGVIKANDIIPQVKENLTNSNTLEIPKQCPCCGHETEIKYTDNAEFLICPNENCTAKLAQKISHYVSRDALNIDGLSIATIEKLIEKGFLKDVSDIYKLESYKSEIVKMDGFGLKSYNNLINAINTSKQCKLSNFIYGLGIPNVGKSTAKNLVEFAMDESIDSFTCLSKIRIFDRWYFLRMKDTGDITANSIYLWFNNSDNEKLLDELLQYVTFIEDKKVEVRGNVLEGMNIYATGTFANFKKADIKKVIEENGGIFASGYAKSLDMLVVGSLKGSSKESKAEKDGVRVVSEDEFINIIGGIN